MKYNDFDLKNWKELDINVDSLWLIDQRKKSGKHSNIYHGNFIPQIPNQLIRRYTLQNEIVFDPFLGSGTTLYECETLSRNFIGFDINDEIIEFVKHQMGKVDAASSINYIIDNCDVSNKKRFKNKIESALNKLGVNRFQFSIMHPPYLDIVKFTDKKEDLSQISDTNKFIDVFMTVVENILFYLEPDRYFSIVIGDVYKDGEVIPLSALIINAVKKNLM